MHTSLHKYLHVEPEEQTGQWTVVSYHGIGWSVLFRCASEREARIWRAAYIKT